MSSNPLKSPLILPCPQCNGRLKFMPRDYIFHNLSINNEFVLMYCDSCNYDITIPELDETKDPDFPF